MLKMRMMFGLIAVVMVLALAQSGYSQLSISATSTPNPTADVVGFNEPTFNPNAGYGGLIITGSVQSDAPFTGGRLRITYPSAITNACTAGSSTSSNGCFSTANGPGTNVPGINCTPNNGTGNVCSAGIQVIEATGVFQGSSIASINAASGTVDITLPCTTSANPNALAGVWNPAGGGHIQGSSGTLILTGVRIDATTATGLPAGPAAATLSLSNGSAGIFSSTFPNTGTVECNGLTTGAGSGIVLNTTSVNIINASAPGIGAVAIGGIPTSVGQPSGSNAFNQGVGSGNNQATGAPCLNAGLIVNPARTVPGFYVNCGVATVFTNKTVQKQFGSFTVKEGFSYAWYHNDATNFNGQDLTPGGNINTTNDAAFQLVFNNLPAGVTLTLAVAAFTGTATGSSAAGAPTFTGSPTATITTAQNTATVVWGGDLDPTSTDWVTFEITNVQVSSSSSVVLSPTNVTVSAQMTPTQTTALNLAKGAGSTQLWAVSNAQYPVFAPSVVSGPTVLTIIPANTTLLIPFAVAQGAFDTGIAVANTSADPFGTQGATPQSGTVTVNLFPSTATGAGTSVSFTTSATKLAGSGIAADGTIPAGATWTVNLSQLLPLAGQTGGFLGYIFIQANFLPAHGAAYVYNGTGFTSSTPVLVLPPPSTNGRNGNNANLGAEVLDF